MKIFLNLILNQLKFFLSRNFHSPHTNLMKEEYFNWFSPHLQRDVLMLCFGHAGYPVIVFPTSKGSFHENRDMGLIESARWYIEQGLIRIYCPESNDADSF